MKSDIIVRICHDNRFCKCSNDSRLPLAVLFASSKQNGYIYIIIHICSMFLCPWILWYYRPITWARHQVSAPVIIHSYSSSDTWIGCHGIRQSAVLHQKKRTGYSTQWTKLTVHWPPGQRSFNTDVHDKINCSLAQINGRFENIVH